MIDSMNPIKFRREQLERKADRRPSGLEKRLARAELNAVDAIEENRAANGSKAVTAVFAILGVLGMLLALIPTLIGIAIVAIPGVLLLMLFMQF